jgi:hypothetical protein
VSAQSHEQAACDNSACDIAAQPQGETIAAAEVFAGVMLAAHHHPPDLAWRHSGRARFTARKSDQSLELEVLRCHDRPEALGDLMNSHTAVRAPRLFGARTAWRDWVNRITI